MGRKYDWFNGCYVGDRPQQEEHGDGQKKRKKPKQKRAIWTLELCKAEAKKYATRSEWAFRSQYSYITARANGWFEECCKHMLLKKAEKYTLEKCREIAKEYSTRGEWQKKFASSYHAARINGWLDECCKHMVSGHTGMNPPNQKYTLESCKKDALKYTTKTEWANNSRYNYEMARTNGWFEECVKHMIPYRVHTIESCKKDALKYKSRTEWHKNSQSMYETARANGWFEECCKHMLIKKAEKYTLEKCKDIALNCLTRIEWQKRFSGSYHAARINGWLDECCKHMVSGHTGMNPPNQKYTLEICKKEALKYNTRNEWRTNDRKMYIAVTSRGWLKECCKHMTSGFKRKKRDNPEKHQFNFFKERALQYKNLNDWRLNDEYNYNIAVTNGWLNKINKLFLLRVLKEIKNEN